MVKVAAVCMALVGAACAVDSDEPSLGEVSSPLYGDVTFEANTQCSSADQSFVREAIRRGRIASASTAFAECVDVRMSTGEGGYGPYIDCGGMVDPYSSAPRWQQIDQAMRVARSPNDVHIRCNGVRDGVAAYATYEDYDLIAPEWFTFVATWLDEQREASIADPDDPHPWARVAGTTWHEVMHQHEYSHDKTCSPEPAGYDYQRDSVPYIVGRCIQHVLQDAGAQCESVVCPAGQIALPTHFRGTACTCYADPQKHGLGLFHAGSDGTLYDFVTAGNGDRIAGWTLGLGDVTHATLDMDADGASELLITGSQGLGRLYLRRVPYTYQWGMANLVRPSEWIGGWRVHASDTIAAVGNIDGVAGDELVIRSPWGIGVITRTPSGALDDLYVYAYGSALGAWTLSANDSIVGVGDYDDDGRDELLVRGSGGLAIVGHVTGYGLRAQRTVAPGSYIGAWQYGGYDRVVASGDFDVDGHVDFVLRGSQGLAVVEYLNGALALQAHHRNGSSIGSWTLQSSDQIVGVGDFNGGGRADLLVRGGAGMAILRGTGGALQLLTRAAWNSSIGGWRLRYADLVLGVGDFDDDGRDEVLVVGSDAATGYGGLTILDSDPKTGAFVQFAEVPWKENGPSVRASEWPTVSEFLLGAWTLSRDDWYGAATVTGMPAHDAMRGIADFNGDGKTDFLIRGD